VNRLGSYYWSRLRGTVRWVPLVRGKWSQGWHLERYIYFSWISWVSSTSNGQWMVGYLYLFLLSQHLLVGQIDLFRSSASTFSGWWPLSLVYLSPFLWFITDNWYLSIIVQLLYPWDFSRVNNGWWNENFPGYIHLYLCRKTIIYIFVERQTFSNWREEKHLHPCRKTDILELARRKNIHLCQKTNSNIWFISKGFSC
jgi:hypothetical protein